MSTFQKRHATLHRIALNGLFISIAIVLSAIERWIPVTSIIPIPGVKLGLANIVTLFLLFFANWKDALLVGVLRCLIVAFLFGGMSSLLFALSGVLLAVPAMVFALMFYAKWFSVIGVSVMGAVGHNIGQLIAASATMKSLAVFGYLPVLLSSAIIMGTLTALVSYPFFRAMKHSGVLYPMRNTNKMSF